MPPKKRKQPAHRNPQNAGKKARPTPDEKEPEPPLEAALFAFLRENERVAALYTPCIPPNFPRGAFALGRGAHSSVFMATRNSTGESVAVKLEVPKPEMTMLTKELKLLVSLLGVPRVVQVSDWFGNLVYQSQKAHALILTLCPISLRAWVGKQGCHSVAPDAVIPMAFRHLAQELIQSFKGIHTRGVIFGDVAPDNFMCDSEAAEARVVTIDFGLASRFEENKSAFKRGFVQGLVEGTAPYESLAAHRLQKPSYKDDMESLGYLLWELIHGPLPWAGKSENEAKAMKELAYDNCPKIIERYLRHCHGLQFEDCPDYAMLCELFSGTQDTHLPELPAEAIYSQWPLERQFHMLPLNRPLTTVPGLDAEDVAALEAKGINKSSQLLGRLQMANGDAVAFEKELITMGVKPESARACVAQLQLRDY